MLEPSDRLALGNERVDHAHSFAAADLDGVRRDDSRLASGDRQRVDGELEAGRGWSAGRGDELRIYLDSEREGAGNSVRRVGAQVGRIVGWPSHAFTGC